MWLRYYCSVQGNITTLCVQPRTIKQCWPRVSHSHCKSSVTQVLLSQEQMQESRLTPSASRKENERWYGHGSNTSETTKNVPRERPDMLNKDTHYAEYPETIFAHLLLSVCEHISNPTLYAQKDSSCPSIIYGKLPGCSSAFETVFTSSTFCLPQTTELPFFHFEALEHYIRPPCN